MKYTVYMHISPSNKKYIGITSQKVVKRWKYGAGYKAQKYFYRAIEKYGWDNFQHIIIAKDLSQDEAKWLEIELIKVWDSTNPNKGYNITNGGGGTNGWTPSEETRKRLSEINKGKTLSEETKRKLSELRSGKEHSEETKEKMRKNNAKYWKDKQMSEETKEKMRKNNAKYWKDKQMSEETKEKLSVARKGKYKGKDHPRAKGVLCLTTKKIFYSIAEASSHYNTFHGNISNCCKGKYKTAGKLSDGTPLVWRYLIWKHDKKYRVVNNILTQER